jgi:arylsulfatase A-like enzyme
MNKRPNIVFVLADQLRLQSCGYAGDELARTPEIDKLANESFSFSNMVSSMPVCSAYRASLFTGKYVTSTGMVINELRMNPDHCCLAHCLTSAGYATGYIGKWHLWANQLGNHHDPKNSYIPPGPFRLGFDGEWAAYNFHHEYYEKNAYYHLDSPEKIYVEGYEPDAQTDMAIDFIRKHASDEQPFFLTLAVGTPHDPWERDNVPPEYYAMFKDADFPLPETYSDVNPDPYGDAWSDIEKDAGALQEWMRVYYAMTSNLDYNIGRLRKALCNSGVEDNTIFIFTSDHGEMFGAHGRMKKNIFYEEAIRVPFLMRWPEKIAPGTASNACITNVDFMPTLLGMLGLDIPAEVEGESFAHSVLGGSGTEPEAALLQNTGACAAWEDGHEWRALRSKRFTYAIFRIDGKELLFDNLNDPAQKNNLAGMPEYAGDMERFRKTLKDKMAELNDTFPASSWYRDNWISPDRIILKSAKSC